MVSKSTRSSRNKKSTGTISSVARRGENDGVNSSEMEADVEASAAADSQIGPATEKGAATKTRAKRRKTSKVWQHFTEGFVEEKVDDVVIQQPVAECKYCNEFLPAPSRQGTTHLWNHYTSFHDGKTEKSSVKKSKVVRRLAKWKYDQKISMRKYYLSIIMHEYPFNYSEHEYTNDFIRSLCPNFPVKGRKTARARIMDIFHDEKKQLFDYFASLDCRFSCTMDLWTSNQNKGYLCVTSHFIDDDWNIHKRIINFMHLEGRHTGVNLSLAFMQNMSSWNLDHKLFALTLDNASSNDVCVDTVISTLNKSHGSLHCDGKFFHVRCAAHIINLIAKDGVSTIATVIANIRALVLIVKTSTLQEEAFRKHAIDLGIAERGLSLDVSTRWNSTYLMLADALHFKKVFQRLILLHPDKYGPHAPTREEWDNAAALRNCLEIFYDATKLLSGTHYPTANLFFSEFCEINLKLIDWQKSNDSFIVSMAKSMKEKFDKYWSMSNVALAVACFLDPRYKMKVVEWYYSLMSDDQGFDDMYEFKKILQKLYDSYASIYCTSSTSYVQQTQAAPVRTTRAARTSQCYMDLNEEPKRKRLSSFLRDNTTEAGQEETDLQQYCNEQLLSWKEGDHFDILSWWKTHGAKYPVLARLARDVLSIPASTVASESAFSSGGRVVNKYRSSLDPEVVEALICTKDWIRASKQGGSVCSTLDELVQLDINDKTEEDEGTADASSENVASLEDEDDCLSY